MAVLVMVPNWADDRPIRDALARARPVISCDVSLAIPQ
jgi:hypothetical protein